MRRKIAGRKGKVEVQFRKRRKYRMGKEKGIEIGRKRGVEEKGEKEEKKSNRN